MARKFWQINTHVRTARDTQPEVCIPRSLAFCTHKLSCTWLLSWTVSGVTVFHWFTSYFDIMHQGESNPPGLSKRLTPKLLQMRELGETPGTTLWNLSSGWGLHACSWPSSPSRSFREPVHLSAFLFASFPNAYESTIWWYSILFCARFSMTNPSVKWDRRESEICNATAIFKVSGKLSLLMNLNQVPLIVLGFTIFIFPLIL